MIEFFRKLWPFIRPYRTRMILGLLCGVGYAAWNAALLGVVKVVPDLVFAPPGTDVLAVPLAKTPEFLGLQGWLLAHLSGCLVAGSRSAILTGIVLIPGVMFLRGLFAYLNVYLMNWVAVHSVADLRTRLFTHLQHLSMSFFHQARSGDLISRITNDTVALFGTIGFSLSTLVRDPITVLLLLGVLLWQQWQLTLISMLVFPVCIVPIVIYGRKVRKSAQAAQDHMADLTDVMQEAFTGNRIIKAYNLEALVQQRFLATTARYVSQFMRIVRAQEIPGPLIEFFGAVGVAMVFLYVGILTQAKSRATPGDFLQFVLGIFMVYGPIKAISRLQNQLEQARAASQRVFELLAVQSTIPEPSAPKPLHAAGAEIHFDGVDFAYGDKPALRGIQLRVQPGQLVALVGASGSGKTTLANLLLRFYDPQRGAVRIGGTDLREVATRDLRNQIAIVTQETILFNETIRRNIELGRPGASEADIVAAARHAHAEEFILEKPGGYGSRVGEKGVNLSGGQRQRLAIARAMLRNAPILVLDEATSALDTESERAVQAALDELMQGRTTLCIAHRLSTILHADVIVVLDQGRIAETGRHEELVRRGGIYQKLYEMQFRE